MDKAVGADEAWRPIPKFEAYYQVSNYGRVKSLRLHRVLSPYKDGDGYPRICLWADGKKIAVSVHRMVALAFHGESRNALHSEVAHLDGDRANARADNLKWVSKVENHSHKLLHGTHQRGAKAGHRILMPEQVSTIRSAKGTATAQDLGERFGVSRHAIYDIWRGRRWAHAQ